MSLVDIADIFSLFSQPTFALVEASSPTIDLFTIWKYCALGVAGIKVFEQLAYILSILIDA